MFVVLKKKSIVVLLIVLVCFILLFTYCSIKAQPTFLVPNSKYLVVIDAGHGGIDGGSVGKKTGISESELNLAFAFNLANQLKKMDISCVLTRTNSDGLYEKNVSSLKKSDMKKRREVIEKTNPDLVISIHMNSFPTSSCRGAQVFYKNGSEQGKIFAQSVQNQLFSCLNFAKKQAQVGDYYMVNCTEKPAILVECGFLSNPEEEQLLISKDYQTKVCYAIVSGVVSYLNQSVNF